MLGHMLKMLFNVSKCGVLQITLAFNKLKATLIIILMAACCSLLQNIGILGYYSIIKCHGTLILINSVTRRIDYWVF